MERLRHGTRTVAPSLATYLIYWGSSYHKTSKTQDSNWNLTRWKTCTPEYDIFRQGIWKFFLQMKSKWKAILKNGGLIAAIYWLQGWLPDQTDQSGVLSRKTELFRGSHSVPPEDTRGSFGPHAFDRGRRWLGYWTLDALIGCQLFVIVYMV